MGRLRDPAVSAIWALAGVLMAIAMTAVAFGGLLYGRGDHGWAFVLFGTAIVIGLVSLALFTVPFLSSSGPSEMTLPDRWYAVRERGVIRIGGSVGISPGSNSFIVKKLHGEARSENGTRADLVSPRPTINEVYDGPWNIDLEGSMTDDDSTTVEVEVWMVLADRSKAHLKKVLGIS